MRRFQTIQGILSVAALFCLVVGWFNIFSPEITELLNSRVFYFLIGVSFVFQAQLIPNKQMVFAMYAAAALCIVGAFLPFNSDLAAIKTIGLFAGVIISMFNRQRRPQN